MSSSSTLSKNKKGWKSVKGVIKTLFNTNNTFKDNSDSDDSSTLYDSYNWKPPIILKLEESVFNPDYGIMLDCSANNSTESLLESNSSSSSLTMNQSFYMTKNCSNVKLPIKSAIKRINRSSSEPNFINLLVDNNSSETLDYLQIKFHFEDDSQIENMQPITRCATTSPTVKLLPKSPPIVQKCNTPRKGNKNFRFDENVLVYETYSIEDYPRTSVDPPEFTAKQIDKINKEIRRFKLDEMKVHPDSLNNLLLTI